MTDLLEASLAAHAEGKLLTAYNLARTHTTANPTSARAWHQLGLLLFEMGDLPKSAAMLDRALTLAPTHATLLHLRARVELARGRPAEDWLDRAEHARPDDPALSLTRAMAALAAGDPASALALFTRVTTAWPTLIQGHASLAALRYQLGQQDGFADSYEVALRTRPDNAALWQSYATTLLRATLPAQALAVIARARLGVGEEAVLTPIEVSALTDLGEHAAASIRLAASPVTADSAPLRHARLRHLLASGDTGTAASLAEATVATPDGAGVWPLLATAWATLADPRHDWLLGRPGLVGVYDLGDPPAALADALRKHHRTRVEPPEQSLRGGTQTDGDILFIEEPPILLLRARLEAAVATHISALPPPDPMHPILARPRGRTRFNGSWSVRLADGGHHIDHVHPKGWFSSAYYVALPKTAPRGGWLRLGQPPPELRQPPRALRYIEPRPGRLVLFPSLLWHGTEPFQVGERLTVAFDIVPLI